MIKVASWNVNSIKARLERALAFVDREQPDILAMQELKCTTEAFPYLEFENRGYHCAVFGQKTYNGVAILAKKASKDIIMGVFNNHTEARMIKASFDAVDVICVYVPNGREIGHEQYQHKLTWLAQLKDYLIKTYRPEDKYIVLGDFNVAPEDIDVHDPSAWQGQILFSEQERATLRQLMSVGLIDSFRLYHQDGGHYTWWDYRRLAFPKNQGLRIDFILISESLVSCCKRAVIDRDERKGPKPSDHAPVMAEFQLDL